MKYTWSVWIILGILLSMGVYATVDFSAATKYSSLGLCSCTTYNNEIFITNTGSEALQLGAGNVESPAWVSTTPAGVGMRVGEQKKFTTRIEVPCDVRGNYPLNTRFKTHTGLTKQITQTMEVNKCSNTQLLLFDQELNSCPCKTQKVRFEVRNIGGFTEKYTLNMTPYSEHVQMSNSSFELERGESKEITATVALPCDVAGLQTLNLLVYSHNNDILSKVPIDYTINQCYDFTLDVSSQTHAVCSDARNTVPLTIHNEGDVDNFYTLEFDVEWAGVPNATLAIPAGKKQTVDVVLTPDNVVEKEYAITVLTQAQYGKAKHQDTLTVDVQECYALSSDTHDLKACEARTQQVSIGIANTGETQQAVRLSVHGQEWVSGGSSATLAPTEEATLRFDAAPPLGSAGVHAVLLNFTNTDTGAYFEQDVALVVAPQESCSLVGVHTDEHLHVGYAHKQIPFVVENRGVGRQTYSLSLDAGEWVRLTQDTVSLNPGEKEVLTLDVTPTPDIAPGKYAITVFIHTGVEDVVYSKSFIIRLGNYSYVRELIGPVFIGILALGLLIKGYRRLRNKNRMITIKLLRDDEEVHDDIIAPPARAEKKARKFPIWVRIVGVVAFVSIALTGTLLYFGWRFPLSLEAASGLVSYYIVYVVLSLLVLISVIFFRERRRKRQVVDDEDEIMILDAEEEDEVQVEEPVASKPEPAKKPAIATKKPTTAKDIVANFAALDEADKAKRKSKKKKAVKKQPVKKAVKKKKPSKKKK